MLNAATARPPRAPGSSSGIAAGNLMGAVGMASLLAQAFARLVRQPLLWICLFALTVRLGVFWLVPSLQQADEVFQSFEQAHRLVFGNGIVPWEFQRGLRSWLLPGFLAVVMAAWQPVYLAAAHVTLALISLAPVIVGYLWGQRLFGRTGAVIGGSLAAVWFELILFAARGFSEVVAGHLLILGAYWLLASENDEGSAGRTLAGGMAVALALALRVQLLPAVGALGVVVLLKRKRWERAALGAGIIILAVGLLDWATWGAPYHSYTLYLHVHLVENVAQHFGVQPVTFYAAKMYHHWLWGLPVMLFFVWRGAKRLPAVALTAIIIVLSHSMVPHKEYRYMYPAILLVVLLMGIGSADWLRRLQERKAWASRPLAAGLLVMGWMVLSTFLALTGRYSTYWTAKQGFILAARELRSAENACGVGIWQLPWAYSGGYTYLHRDLPLYPLHTQGAADQLAPAFNYILVRSPDYQQELTSPYTRWKCWTEGGRIEGQVCLLSREGGCVASSAHQIRHPLGGREILRFE